MSLASSSPRILNLNVGLMGHVDSGKTSLAKALSTHLSTSALDKNPQAQARGITNDLGFSAFYIDAQRLPDKIRSSYDLVQVTLVDCPGHAALIRTVLGGAAIIDLIILVVDCSKGIQTQTAECLIIGEILTNKMILALNKCDLLAGNPEKLEKVEKGLRNTFKSTKFGAALPIARVTANPGASDDLKKPEFIPGQEKVENSQKAPPVVGALVDCLIASLEIPERSLLNSPFLFSVDHCFLIKGQGTILTGTVLAGRVKVGDSIELPGLKTEKKVKSMQMFKKPVDTAMQGDRVGICVTQLDSKLLERGLVCAPGSIPSYSSVVLSCEKIRFFKSPVASKAKFHVSIGHDTTMGNATFFQTEEKQAENQPFDFKQEYKFLSELPGFSSDFPPPRVFALLEFERPVLCPPGSAVIASRLDSDLTLNQCRIAFHGKILSGISVDSNSSPAGLPLLSDLKVFKPKERLGTIERVHDPQTIIGKDLFVKGGDVAPFLSLKVEFQDCPALVGVTGEIIGGFGKGNKFKVSLPSGVSVDSARGKIILRYKKYCFQEKGKSKFVQ